MLNRIDYFKVGFKHGLTLISRIKRGLPKSSHERSSAGGEAAVVPSCIVASRAEATSPIEDRRLDCFNTSSLDLVR